jgi:glycosyltransferase involved in cell wall biosynthesis
MKILIVNKFLYPHGGSETYIFEIGKELQRLGHEVQYFGMEHEGNIVGNHAESYTSDLDFHKKSLSTITYPFKIIYSIDAKKKIRKVLEDFFPDVVHLNNINFQITPSIIDEIKHFDPKIRVVYTAHDLQWVCPNHRMRLSGTENFCKLCAEGKYMNCAKYKCIHNSRARSILGAIEGWYYRKKKTYSKVDSIICPSEFMEKMLSMNDTLKGRTKVLRNFIPEAQAESNTADQSIVNNLPEKYVLYFGRFEEEKGIDVIIKACKELPQISFVFAGNGTAENEISELPNCYNTGFLKGQTLTQVIKRAEFTVYPSLAYENCPFSIMESMIEGTPVIASDIGGIPELLDNGRTDDTKNHAGVLFKPGNVEELTEDIRRLWNSQDTVDAMSKSCVNIAGNSFSSVQQYCEDLIRIYQLSK